MQFYSYIEIKNIKNKDGLTNIINQLFPSYVLEWDNNIAKLSVIDDPSFQLKLEKLHYSSFIDGNIFSSILIVPYFDSLFIKYLKKLNNEVSTAYDIFIRHSKEEETLLDAEKILKSITSENLDTIKAYFKTNHNANAAAEELFLHKNSYAYRIKKFTNDTFIEYNDNNSLSFLRLIISLTS